MKRLIKYKKFLEQKNNETYIANDPFDDSHWRFEKYDLEEFFINFMDDGYEIKADTCYYPTYWDVSRGYNKSKEKTDFTSGMNPDEVSVGSYYIGYEITILQEDRVNISGNLNKEFEVAIDRLCSYLQKNKNEIKVYEQRFSHHGVYFYPNLISDLSEIKFTTDSIRFSTDSTKFRIGSDNYTNRLLIKFEIGKIDFSIRDIHELHNIDAKYESYGSLDNIPYLEYTWKEMLDLLNYSVSIGGNDITEFVYKNEMIDEFWDIFNYDYDYDMYETYTILNYELSDENLELLKKALLKELTDLKEEDLEENLEEICKHSDIFNEIYRMYNSMKVDSIAYKSFNDAINALEDEIMDEFRVKIINKEEEDISKRRYKIFADDSFYENLDVEDFNNLNFSDILENYLNNYSTINVNVSHSDNPSINRESFNLEVKDILS